MPKQDRQAPRTVSDLERRYGFGKTFAEILGIAEEARDTANEAAKLDSKLTQEEIFNRLTNNGEVEGIYRDDNGDVYINASYIVSGILKSKDSKVFYLDLDKGILNMNATSLSIAGKTVGELTEAALDSQTQEDVFNKLTNNGETQGIYLKDGKLYINLEYADAGYLAADNMTLRGLFSVYYDSAGRAIDLGGYLGGASGDRDGVQTDGIALLNKSKNCYAIATDNGVRLQAGDYFVYITSDGFAEINSKSLSINGKAVSWKDNGDGTFTLIGT